MGRDKGFCRGWVAEAAIGSGRNPGAHTEVLGIGLRAFEGGGGGTRAKCRDTFAFESVDEPRDERRLGTDDDEIDALAAAEPDQPRDVGRADRDALSLFSDPGVAGRTVEGVDQW